MTCEKIQFYNVNIDKIESCIFNESFVNMIVFENVNVNVCHPEAYNNYYGNISFINYSACCNDDSVCMLGSIVFNNCSLVKYSFISNLADNEAKKHFLTNTYSEFVDNYNKDVNDTFKPTDEMKNKKFETKIEHININTLKPDEFKTENECALSCGNANKQSHIHDCISGKRKSAYGFVWKRIPQ